MSGDPHAYITGGLGPGKRPHAAVMVIFGASGDLTRRKLIPALYNLALQGRLPERFAVVGYGRTEMTHETFREKMRAAVREFSRTGLRDEESWRQFASTLYFLPGDYQSPPDYEGLKRFVDRFDQGTRALPVRVLYLAIPPELYATVMQHASAAGLVLREEAAEPRTRVVFEKPFGGDLESARELNRSVHEVLHENQVYRIDHYLGKETVQNIMVFRFANSVFEPIWNRRYVDHVQITAAETVGVEGRGGYYDRAGVVRDMVQNHLLQLLCLTAMEPPVAFSADAVRDEKMKLLRAVRPLSADHQDAVRAQYGRGKTHGREVCAYREERGVARDSRTETFAALKLLVDNWRWEGVPFYLRSGKRMAKRVTEIAIQFKRPPLLMFRACALDEVSPNVLCLRIQPGEGISLTFNVKPPGPDICVRPLSLDFSYEQAFGSGAPEAYETLLEDCIEGDSTLFTRHDWVELAWSLVNPVITAWSQRGAEDLPVYEAGSWGPREADELMARDGRRWRRP